MRYHSYVKKKDKKKLIILCQIMRSLDILKRKKTVKSYGSQKIFSKDIDVDLKLQVYRHLGLRYRKKQKNV